MRYKNGKQYQICHHQIRFFELKMHQNLFSARAPPGHRWGAYGAPPDPLVGWEGGTPPHTIPHSTPSASRTLRPPSTQNPGYAKAFNSLNDRVGVVRIKTMS